MKKMTAIFLLLALCLFGCSEEEAYDGLRSSDYRSEYSFYDTNVQVMMESMQLDAQQADTAFGLLIDAGIQEEISNIIQMSDGLGETYYRIWWGEDYSTSAEVYVEDGTVTKISSGDTVLYDINGADTTEESPATEQVDGEAEEHEETVGETTQGESPSDSDVPAESGTIALQSVTSPVKRGSTAYMEIKGTPGVEYSIVVRYSTSVSKAADLVPKVADENGLVTWKWRVGSRTTPGTYTITVTGGGDTLETVFVVTDT